MNNALRLGAAVAATALVGLASDSAEALFADSGEAIPLTCPLCPEPTAEINRLNLELIQARQLNGELKATLDQTNAQMQEVLMQFDTMEQACEDAVCEDTQVKTGAVRKDSRYPNFDGGLWSR